MLSYRHSFHAGSHADVLKHIIQSLIIESLKEKDRPPPYLDTRTGAGCYQLGNEHAEHTGKYLEGIARIWQQGDLPAELEAYINVVKHFNRSGQLRYHPDSPSIARQLLRKQGNLQLTELHPSGYPLLRSESQKDSRTRVEKADGFQQLRAKLPPVSRRSLILIDPPYEMKTDHQAMASRVAGDYKCFAIGTYALWYPVVLHQQVKRMTYDLEATGICKIPQIELTVLPGDDRHGMTTSGMIMISLPWKLEQRMNNVLPWLHNKLVLTGTGYATVSWIMPE